MRRAIATGCFRANPENPGPASLGLHSVKGGASKQVSGLILMP